MSQEQFTVYIIRNRVGRLYIGQTKRLDARTKEHAGSRGAAFVRQYGGGEVVYREILSTLKQARTREQQLKRWSRAKKEALIRGDMGTLIVLAKG